MIDRVFKYAKSSLNLWWIEPILACRAFLFVGNKYVCPCCEWKLRVFTHGGSSIKPRPAGYCPRCNSKARHRRDWLYLKARTNLFSRHVRLLHVSPKYALSRRLTKMPMVDFVGVDIYPRPHVSHIVDIIDIPFENDSFDAIICIHVLEHIEDDRKAIAELNRVLRPGGWAVITVPINLNNQTYEDASIVSPKERKKHFGEETHIRHYGADFMDRLEEGGFDVELDRGTDVPLERRSKFGLLEDENVFYCTKL